MTSLRDGKIWCMWVFWSVYVRSTVYDTYYIRKKQDGTSQETKEPLYSVLEDNLVSCAVTCGTHGKCLYFVYSGHRKRYRGYSDDLCDDGRRHDRTAVDVMYQHMKRCPRKKTTYKLTFSTGSLRDSDSGADLTVGIIGPCGRAGVTLKNGKDVKLRKGRRSIFRVVVEYEEMTTGDRDRVKFETNYWLRANKEHDQTTGIGWYYVPAFAILGRPLGVTKCQPSQKCEH